MFRIILILSLSLFITSCATSNAYDDNDSQISQNKESDAYHTGMHYLLGKGVPQDYSKAMYWLKKSASDENPYAESELGFMYTAGKGVPQDYGMAMHWYRKAASHGLASAQYNLGLMYANGIGTPVDKIMARKLFAQAAQRGFVPAQRALAGN